MLHRLIVSLCITLLFALTQIGAVTHEISHYSTPNQQSQHDQHTAPDQCTQCLAYAQSAAGTLVQLFGLPDIPSEFHFSSQHVSQLVSFIAATYRARAPPCHLI